MNVYKQTPRKERVENANAYAMVRILVDKGSPNDSADGFHRASDSINCCSGEIMLVDVVVGKPASPDIKTLAGTA